LPAARSSRFGYSLLLRRLTRSAWVLWFAPRTQGANIPPSAWRPIEAHDTKKACETSMGRSGGPVSGGTFMMCLPTPWTRVGQRGSEAMTVREQETLLRALDLWQTALGQMTWERRAEAALALLIVRDDEIEALRRRIQRGEIGG
jgi:hypothetical protein